MSKSRFLTPSTVRFFAAGVDTRFFVANTVKDSAFTAVGSNAPLSSASRPTTAWFSLRDTSTANEAPTPVLLSPPLESAPARACAEILLVSVAVTDTCPTSLPAEPSEAPSSMEASVLFSLTTRASPPATAVPPPLAPETASALMAVWKAASRFWRDAALMFTSPAWLTVVPAPRVACVTLWVAVTATATPTASSSDTASPLDFVV